MHAISYQQNTGLTPVAMINRNQPCAADKHEQIRDAVRAWPRHWITRMSLPGSSLRSGNDRAAPGWNFPKT